MLMYIAIIAFIFTVFSLILYLSLKNDADQEKSRLVVQVDFILGWCVAAGIIISIVFFLASVKYE